MLLTLFLLGLVYALLVGVLIAAGAGAVTIAVIAGLLFLVQFFTSDKIALFSMGAREVSPQQAPELHAIVERLCVQANLPKPRVAIAQTAMPNAFAVGRSPRAATVCATTGLLDLLSPSELEAVLGHELTHVQNRDVLVMTIASFFASIAAFVVQFGFFFGGGFGGDDDSEGGGFAIVLLVSFAVYILSFFLMLSLSRYREYGADRGAAIITGRPSALSSALMKLSSAMQRVPDQDLRAVGRMNAFFIIPTSVKESVGTLFMTHPPMEKRIERLQQYEAQLQGTAVAA